MRKKSIVATTPSTIVWENLEQFARLKIQEFLQNVLEEEVTELLGRKKYERSGPVDGEGQRNGYGKPRKLTMTIGTVKVKRPRVRGLEERFESRILPLFATRTKDVGELLPELYLHGLSSGDFDLALRGLLGEDAPLSPQTINRLKEKWQAEKVLWDQRSLEELQPVYVWVDGIYVKAGLEKEKACVFVALAALRDGTKVVISLTPGHRESKESWASFLRNLKQRGMKTPRLIIGDGNLGIWSAVSEIFPGADEQRCWNHRIVNAVDKITKKLQPTGRELIKKIPYAETLKKAEELKREFQKWCIKHEQHAAAKVLDVDWDRMITFYNFPKEHWVHLRTSNVVESPFATLRLRTDAARRYKKVDNATAVMWKMLLVVEKRFNKLHAAEKMEEVFQKVKYQDGNKVNETKQEQKMRKAA